MYRDKALAQFLLFSSFLLFSCLKSFGQTNVPAGNVSGIWTKQNSPYNIHNNITVPAGETLTIEAGVEVLFFGHYSLSINGNLLARGTEADSIIFDRFDEKSFWHSIRIENVDTYSDSTIFEYCRIAHTNYLDGNNVSTNGGSAIFVKNFDKVRVSHSLLRNNKGWGGAGVYAEKANIIVNKNTIRNNSVQLSGSGIYIEGGSPLIRGNRIERNYAGSGAGGIYLSESNSTIENNIISYNNCYWSGAGVVIRSNSNGILLRNIISYNESGHDNGGGIMISSSSPQIINNTIAFNKAERGEGVSITSSSNPKFINTLIFYNRDRYDNINSNDEVYIASSNSQPSFFNCNIQAGISGIGTHNDGIFNGIAINNINGPPLFINSASNNLELLWYKYPVINEEKSPCIDAGTLDSPHDPDGSISDIGARYFHQTLGNFPPRVDFVADTLLGVQSLKVNFTDLTDKGNGAIMEWHWAFGDGNTSTEQHPIHEYATEGRFNVTLTVKDEKGYERTITKEKYIRLISGIYVKGIVNGTFDSPRYVVGGDLYVQSGKTLEINPGVEMMFIGPYKIDVRGALKAKGTALKPIVFTSYDTTGLDLPHATIGYSQKPGGWAGIYVYSSGSQDSTIIDHCKIQFVENNGNGAIYAFAANGAAGIRISNSELSYNSTQGIIVHSSSIIIRNNFIHHNYARGYHKGAGIYFRAGSSKVINNIITNNETADDGGGICVDWDSRPSLIGNVIMYNKAQRAGGICDYAGWIELINNTIAYNSSTNSSGGGYYILNAGDVTFTNNIISNNTPAQIEVSDQHTRIGFRNCILEGGIEGIVGHKNNIFLSENVVTESPKLVSGMAGYGRLLPGSPAVNDGTLSGIPSHLPTHDVVGNARVVDSQIDIGAYEYTSDPSISIVTTNTELTQEEDFDPFIVPVESFFGYQYGPKLLSYDIANVSAVNLLNVDIRDNYLYFTPIADHFGDQTVEITATNGMELATTSFLIHINPIDDTPRFRIDGDLTVNEDFTGAISYTIDVTIPFGEENQSRVFSLEPDSSDFANVNFTPTGTLVFSARPNQFGSQQFTLNLTEGELTNSQNFYFTVQPVNDPPVISVSNSTIVIKIGEEAVIPVSVSDVDGDLVTLTSRPLNSLISLSSTNTDVNQYDITVTPHTTGSTSIKLTAMDKEFTTNINIPVTITLITDVDEETLFHSVYPNPVIDHIVVNAKEKSSITLYNTYGQEVLRAKMDKANQTFELGNLVPGVYLLRVNDGTTMRFFRILKQ